MTNKIKFLSLLKRKAGMTEDAFARHWQKIHAPIVIEHLAKPAHFLRYDQNICIKTSFSELTHLDADGLSEAWFASADDILRVPSLLSPKQLNDERNFLLPNAPVLFLEELRVAEASQSEQQTRAFILLRAANSTSLAALTHCLLVWSDSFVKQDIDIGVSVNTVIPQQRTLVEPLFDAVLEMEGAQDKVVQAWSARSGALLESIKADVIHEATRVTLADVVRMM